MAQYVFTMNRVGKVVPPKRQILKDISLSFFPGAKIGVLGLNGSGKSSLLRIMAGVDKEIEGEAVPMPDLKIGFLPQEPQLDPAKTVREAVEEGMSEVLGAQKRLDEVYAAYAEADADFDALAAEQARLEAIIATSGVGHRTCRWRSRPTRCACRRGTRRSPNLSGGEKRRVALCRLLLSKPDMLLLDEPTNHLDAESVDWLEQFLQRFPGTVVAVTHDRYFLDNAAEWILELDRGRGIPWKGNYSSWLEQKEQRLEIESKQEQARIKAMKQELEWVRKNPKGRQAKSKARIARFDELNSYEHQTRNETQRDLHSRRRAAGQRGDRVRERLQGLRRPPADRQPLVQDSAGRHRRHHRAQRRRQVDAVPHDHGQGEAGQREGHDRPHRAARGTWTSRATRCPTTRRRGRRSPTGRTSCTVGKFEMQSRAYLGRFNFKGQDQQKLVGKLSGGERGRLHLAKTLLDGGNVLLLDEPSNDLDVETLRALEDALSEFAGSVMVISHDRWFLDRISTHILAAEDDSQWFFYEGNYREYEENKRRAPGRGGRAPHRLRFKPLMT